MIPYRTWLLALGMMDALLCLRLGFLERLGAPLSKLLVSGMLGGHVSKN